MIHHPNPLCSLCNTTNTQRFSYSENRQYHLCQDCDVVFVEKHFLLDKEREKAKYDNHQNSPQDKGYCDFLDKLLVPLAKHLQEGAHGLDFGSGPGPTLSIMMKERGYEMDIYDIFYHDKPEVFEKQYDFITTTEVVEHLHQPLMEIERLWSCLKEGGVLGIMTAFRVEAFSSWYYKRDLTHILFFTPKTFIWLAAYLGASLEIPQSGVALLKKGTS